MVFRFHKPPPQLRDYLYIDSEVDSLFDQIEPSVRKRISAELHINLKLVGLTLRPVDAPGPTQTAKLRIVEQYINEHENIGTVDEPGRRYFHGQMNMRWGKAGDSDDRVWFNGEDSGGSQYVVLFGSEHYVLNNHQPDIPLPPAPRIFFEKLFEPFLSGAEHLAGERGRALISLHINRWNEIWSYCSLQRLEFLARRVDEIREARLSQPVHIVIGTPLYVVLAC